MTTQIPQSNKANSHLNLLIYFTPRVNTKCFLPFLPSLPSFLQHLLASLAFICHWKYLSGSSSCQVHCNCTWGFTDYSCLLPFSSSVVSCTSGLFMLLLSSTIFHVQLWPYLSTTQLTIVSIFFHIQRYIFWSLFFYINLLSLRNSIFN
jgi:hypothetical protein